ncbi:energy-coupling factor transporter transmembrane component T family protein [Haloechinothrix alba]|nr:energy-coupling factor transporter transmembrane protein EcfT [Haloechinothrix alba]
MGLYRPGRSVVHRLPAGPKLAALVLFGIGTVLLDHLWQVGIALLVVLFGYRVAGTSLPAALHTAWFQVRPLWWMLAAIGVFHAVTAGWQAAVTVVGSLLGLILLAALVTLTTRTIELVDVVVRVIRPVRRIGIDPERVGLLLTLGIRAVPVVANLAGQVRDAQRARGLATSVRAFAVPLVVRALRHADRMGEALAARGVDD